MTLAANRVNRVPSVGESDALGLHCKRVACWSTELADRLGLNPQAKSVLWNAALEHHSPALSLGDAGFTRLLDDLGVSGFSAERSTEIDEEPYQVLAAFRHRLEGKVPPHLEQLASILEEANILDEAFETESWSPGDLEHDPWVSQVLEKLRVLHHGAAHYAKQHLPDLPPLAKEALKVFGMTSVAPQELARISHADPMVEECLIAGANSASDPSERIHSVDEAITRLGSEAAQKVLLAASLRPLFAPQKFQMLWNHSLDAAQICEQLATIAGSWSAPEAFLAGLTHDIGRLVTMELPVEFQDRYARLIGQGCPMLETETALAGFTHADSGAAILQAWDFAPALVDAVGNHHRLGDPANKLAALLYLAEFWCAEEEDLPSSIRLHTALAACGLDDSTLLAGDLHLAPSMNALRFGVPDA